MCECNVSNQWQVINLTNIVSYWQDLVTIRCLTKGIFYSECWDLHGISQSSVCIAMDRVLTSRCHRLQNIFSFPSSEEKIFLKKFQSPNVLSVLKFTLPSKISQASFVGMICMPLMFRLFLILFWNFNELKKKNYPS